MVLNRLVRYNAVQEQANTNWTGGSGLVLFKEAGSASTLPEARFRFTDFPLLSAGGDHFNGGSLLGVLALTDCQLQGGRLIFTNGVSGRTLALTPTEFKLLVTLMRHAGDVVSPKDLVKEVWGAQYASEIGNVRRYIWHLRQKIEPDPENPHYIHNDRGFGYRFGPQQVK